MYKYYSAIAAFALLAACGTMRHGGKQQAAMPGTWQATPIVIDGDSKDWPAPYPNYDPKGKIAYATSNDGENLYITMQTGDEMTQVKMLKQGMTVSVDTGGNKETTFRINYPLQNDNEPIEQFKQDLLVRESRNSLIKRQSEQRINKLVQEANQLSLEGFAACSGGYLASQENPCGIKVKMRIDEYKELVWEAVIPLKVLYPGSQLSKSDAGHPVSVCFAIRGFKGKSAKGESGSSPGMNDGMGGAGRNSAMQGGRSGMRMPANDPLQHLYESTKTWKQFSLAFQ